MGLKETTLRSIENCSWNYDCYWIMFKNVLEIKVGNCKCLNVHGIEEKLIEIYSKIVHGIIILSMSWLLEKASYVKVLIR